MDDIKEKIKQALRHIWTNKYRLFLCLLTLCCLFGLIHYFKSADSATASISFNYSEAALGMNPNKFMCSIESLMKRVQKSGALPHINTVVDLGNAFSLTYQLPMGAHDVDKLEGDIQIRFSTPEDHFLPMGEEGMETMPAGELVYVSGHTVKTRRWIWRQSEDGKITGDTSHVFFPIDGFRNVNGAAVLAARDALARLLEQDFGCQVVTGYVDSGNNVFDFE